MCVCYYMAILLCIYRLHTPGLHRGVECLHSLGAWQCTVYVLCQVYTKERGPPLACIHTIPDSSDKQINVNVHAFHCGFCSASAERV